MSTNAVTELHASGQANVHIGNSYSNDVHVYSEPNANRCLADLFWTDPRVDKARIEQTQGGLLRDSYQWILDHEDFRRWRDDKNSRLLWIRGDAGKGKTMLLCGIVDELLKTSQGIDAQGHQLSGMVHRLSRRFKKLSLSPALPEMPCFFFCQATNNRLNHSTAVLRGLVYLLLLQQPSLIRHIQQRYDHAGRRLYEGPESFYTLSQALSSMLQDRRAKGCYMVIDALDECETGLSQLLDFVVHNASSTSSDIKWIVSSRNRHDIEQRLGADNSRKMLSLELNAQHVDRAINVYIKYKVSQLVSLKDDKQLQDQVRATMHRKAEGTFLWVALVAKELEKVQTWDVLEIIEQMPAGLVPLYERMMGSIQRLSPANREYCRRVISTAAIVYRPLRLCELGLLACLPVDISSRPGSIAKAVAMCGSFLTIRDDSVYLIHQSVKDYLAEEGASSIFTSGIAATHQTIFSRSLQVMTDVLQRDMYALRQPGYPIDKVEPPNPDPLETVRYACVYWIDHLRDCDPSSNAATDLRDDGSVAKFLTSKYLYWLEALSLIRSLSEGTASILRLRALLLVNFHHVRLRK